MLAAGPVNRLGIRGGGTPDEVAEFMAYVEALRQLVHHPLAVCFAHHTNKAGSVSGAWEGVPDTLVHVKAVGNGLTKVHWQKVRWGSDLHGKTWELGWREGQTYELLEQVERTREDVKADMVEWLSDNPLCAWRHLRDSVEGNSRMLEEVRDEMLASGELMNDGTPRRMRLRLPEQAAAPDAGEQTDLLGDDSGDSDGWF